MDLPNLPLPRLPERAPESHKGDFGRALLVGGSRGMSGAISLAGMAALRSGAGLVTLAVPEACLDVVAGFDPCYMTIPLGEDAAGRIRAAGRDAILAAAESADCVAIGPGLGRSDELTELLGGFYRGTAKPLVIDADGLNALAVAPGLLRQPGGVRVLTPHPGEFRRLVGAKSGMEVAEMRKQAIDLAAECNVVIVLKGHRSLVTDGQTASYNVTGNPGMATGGSGDVLTGVITALICQGLAAIQAAQLGVHLHGLAGDIAAESMGQISMTAADIVRFLPQAFQRFEAMGGA